MKQLGKLFLYEFYCKLVSKLRIIIKIVKKLNIRRVNHFGKQ